MQHSNIQRTSVEIIFRIYEICTVGCSQQGSDYIDLIVNDGIVEGTKVKEPVVNFGISIANPVTISFDKQRFDSKQ